jgi:hypothetical protein
MEKIHHFYLTFNPFLNKNYDQGYTQCHEFYDFLLDCLKDDNNSSAFWGKMIAKNRDSKLNFESLHEVVENNSELGLSTHLYITDFQHLWVGRVKSVSNKLPKNAKTLPFYDGKNVEVWFEIDDFFLLESNTENTANKLSELYIDNEYNSLKIDGLSPFTTKVTYPCIIQDLAEEQFFDEFDDEKCNKLIYKNNPAIQKNSNGQVIKILQTYVFPDKMYDKIPHAAKIEIESAEVKMLEDRHVNIQQVAFSHIKALEVVLNDLIIHHLKKKGFAEDFYVDTSVAPPRLYIYNEKHGLQTLKQFHKNISIRGLLVFLSKCKSGNSMVFKKAFSKHKSFLNFCSKELEQIIEDNKIIEVRNHLAHGEIDQVSDQKAMAIRNIILGCGTDGLIASCYRTFYKEEFSKYHNTQVEKENNLSTERKLKLVS